ncbi:hypothetical protein HK098_002168 [Nowakowskiella sp. JEL0407]|nr:hypothetical protein HK098_002168 [Nowakowskiella sp. JEL0407]
MSHQNSPKGQRQNRDYSPDHSNTQYYTQRTRNEKPSPSRIFSHNSEDNYLPTVSSNHSSLSALHSTFSNWSDRGSQNSFESEPDLTPYRQMQVRRSDNRRNEHHDNGTVESLVDIFNFWTTRDGEPREKALGHIRKRSQRGSESQQKQPRVVRTVYREETITQQIDLSVQETAVDFYDGDSSQGYEINHLIVKPEKALPRLTLKDSPRLSPKPAPARKPSNSKSRHQKYSIKRSTSTKSTTTTHDINQALKAVTVKQFPIPGESPYMGNAQTAFSDTSSYDARSIVNTPADFAPNSEYSDSPYSHASTSLTANSPSPIPSMPTSPVIPVGNLVRLPTLEKQHFYKKPNNRDSVISVASTKSTKSVTAQKLKRLSQMTAATFRSFSRRSTRVVEEEIQPPPQPKLSHSTSTSARVNAQVELLNLRHPHIENGSKKQHLNQFSDDAQFVLRRNVSISTTRTFRTNSGQFYTNTNTSTVSKTTAVDSNGVERSLSNRQLQRVRSGRSQTSSMLKRNNSLKLLATLFPGAQVSMIRGSDGMMQLWCTKDDIVSPPEPEKAPQLETPKTPHELTFEPSTGLWTFAPIVTDLTSPEQAQPDEPQEYFVYHPDGYLTPLFTVVDGLEVETQVKQPTQQQTAATNWDSVIDAVLSANPDEDLGASEMFPQSPYISQSSGSNDKWESENSEKRKEVVVVS